MSQGPNLVPGYVHMSKFSHPEYNGLRLLRYNGDTSKAKQEQLKDWKIVYVYAGITNLDRCIISMFGAYQLTVLDHLRRI